ncbi:MAG: DUF4388 domain-containing protein [Planctomycetes bacterium]|nr:DUF4388 domain-containing protein [Planctomycetota bacterium]
MSFQGDVAGLGLGELLQGLARGGREGVLTLRGSGLCARLGVQEGQILFLPEEDEDPEIWRRRCERAWVTDPDQRIDALRMREIAYAVRLEAMFRLLDCEGVHFRFEPGPLPDLTIPVQRARAAPTGPEEPLARMETGATLDVLTPIACPPVSVEFILLEYARLCDELGAHPQAKELSEHFIPRLMAEAAPHRSFERLWQECDGVSNVAEISDRLGWPLRQVRGALVDLFQRGVLRFADAREQLTLAQRELNAGRISRAASRVAGWCQLAPPGTLDAGDLQLLLAEWAKGKLPAALASMETADARTFLRRIDGAHPDPTSAIARWNELRKHHRHDAICELRTLHWQHRSQVESDFPSMTDMLRIARKFQELGHPWRAGLVLRAAASRGPETTAVRMEIGQRMCSVGLVDEGVGWVVEACRTLILGGTPDRALAPLRQLTQLAPAHREVKALLAVAHGKSVTGKRTRRNSVAVLATALAVSIVAVVKVRIDQDYDARLAEVNERLAEPTIALQLLEQNFGDSLAAEIVSLRGQLEERIRNRQLTDRAEWIARFQECQLECTSGDPVLGLRNALALPPAPDAPSIDGEQLPKLSSLLAGLMARFEQTVAEWADPSVDAPEAAHAEQRLARLIQELRSVLASAKETPELLEFRTRMESLALTLGTRSELRATAREKRLRAQNVEKQDSLLAAARAHASAGDLARSVEVYAELAAVPGSEKLMKILEREVNAVREHHRAVIEARELAAAGQHARALERLAEACPRPSEHLLPCRIDSNPPGARVRFSDGSSRTTPFVLETSPGERTQLVFEHDACDSVQLTIAEPADQMVMLSRTPTAWWHTSARVESMPVSVDDHHVVCDREGKLARIDSKGAVTWTQKLNSLGGIARTPVFLPRRAGSLLIVTEDGSAWILDTSDGRVEGPWNAGHPPIAGPEPMSNGVRARFQNGHELTWTTRIKPESDALLDKDAPLAPTRGHDAGLVVIRRSANEATALASPWTAHEVQVLAENFAVRRPKTTEVLFSVRRVDEWNYVAWEAPTARAPRGKLWISDGAGLRAYDL